MNPIFTKDLLCLNKIDKFRWIGLKVYHPMCQHGNVPYWRTEDYPYKDEDDEPGFQYDCGIVKSYQPPDKYGDIRVLFDTGYCKLRYGSDNLWVRINDLKGR
jgi:hypothetical protein